MKLKIVKEQEKISNDWSVEKVATEYPPNTWENVFESAKDEIKDVSDILEKDNGRRVPDNIDLFRIFNLVPIHKVKVVILGQDPYLNILPNGKPQATGMCFSVPREASIPPSLKNIYKELKTNYPNFNPPKHGSLEKWCIQGVFLLNACLTTRQGVSGAHGEIWTGFIKKVINAILDVNPKTIFVLWGKQAQKMKKIIGERATCLEASHPSPLGAYRGFFGCGHFKQINEILIENGSEPIDWNL